jgi:hypothetical protein
MKRLLPILFSAYLTVGSNHNFMLGNGTSLGLEVEQPVADKLSLCPYVSVDNNEGFTDRNSGLNLE